MRDEFQACDTVFEGEIIGCKNIIGVSDNLQPSLPAIDLQDLYRHSLVGAVSALDTFVHSLVRCAIILQFQRIGPSLDQQVPVGLETCRRALTGDASALHELDLKIRRAHGRWTMQCSKDIADALKLATPRPAWITIAGENSNQAKYLKQSLDLIVRRRNQIAHESDIDPSTGDKWPIGSQETLAAIQIINERQQQILHHVANEY